MRFICPCILAGRTSSLPPVASVYGGTRIGFVQNCTSCRPILRDTLIDIGRRLTRLPSKAVSHLAVSRAMTDVDIATVGCPGSPQGLGAPPVSRSRPAINLRTNQNSSRDACSIVQSRVYSEASGTRVADHAGGRSCPYRLLQLPRAAADADDMKATPLQVALSPGSGASKALLPCGA